MLWITLPSLLPIWQKFKNTCTLTITMQWYKIFTPELKELIDSKNIRALSLLLKEIHPADIADIIRELEPSERVITLRVLNKVKIAEVFSLLDPEEEKELLGYFKESRAKSILLEMSRFAGWGIAG